MQDENAFWMDKTFATIYSLALYAVRSALIYYGLAGKARGLLEWISWLLNESVCVH